MAIADRKWSALPVPYAMEFPDRAPQGALLRPGLLRDGGRAAVAAGLADGVPARGDPAAARLRRVRVPRPVGHRVAHRRHGRARVPERVPPSRRQGRRGPRDVRRAGSPVRSTDGATASTARTRTSRSAKTFAEHNLQPDDINLVPVQCEMWGGCAWINLDDDAPPLRAVHRAVRDDPRRVEGGVAADRVVVRLPSPRELEARAGGVHGAVPRGRDAPAAPHRRAGTRRAPARRSTRARSSTPTSTTCAR